jgi:hypothetical protein
MQPFSVQSIAAYVEHAVEAGAVVLECCFGSQFHELLFREMLPQQSIEFIADG